jgi:comEA protein
MGIDFYQRNFAASRIHQIPAEQVSLFQVKQQETALQERINPNTADSERLQRLPGIGPGLAEKIIAYRREKGYFAVPEDLRKVSGIGPATYKKIQPHLTLNE